MQECYAKVVRIADLQACITTTWACSSSIFTIFEFILKWKRLSLSSGFIIIEASINLIDFADWILLSTVLLRGLETKESTMTMACFHWSPLYSIQRHFKQAWDYSTLEHSFLMFSFSWNVSVSGHTVHGRSPTVMMITFPDLFFQRMLFHLLLLSKFQLRASIIVY